MGKRYAGLDKRHRRFIEAQKIFFVGSATADSRVNVSPKGMDSLRILDDNTIAWLNVTGSGNETAAHVQQMPRMTLMFCAFDGDPQILRVYGQARAIHQNDNEWASMAALFENIPGRRQIFLLTLDLVQTSCGMAVPFYEYKGERDQLRDWAAKKGDEGIRSYWAEKNQRSLDDIPTQIVEKNV